MRPVFRIDPALPVGAYKTYAIHARPEARRPATCVDVDCAAYLHGWTTEVDESSDLGAAQAHYVRRESGRAFVEGRTPGGLTVFTFEAGQQCFADHTTVDDRPPIFLVRSGDWRGNPGGQHRVHTRPEHWVEDFSEHQQGLADALQKG